MQIPQQHCRAGPSRGQAHHAPDTRLQGLSLCANRFGWRRAYAHDPQRADARRRERSVRSSTILPAGRVTPTGSLTRGETVPPTLTRAPLNATEPPIADIASKPRFIVRRKAVELLKLLDLLDVVVPRLGVQNIGSGRTGHAQGKNTHCDEGKAAHLSCEFPR